MFDPFDDFESAGYLRNVRKDKDPHIIKRFEHDLFEANIDIALAYLAQCERLGYEDFLKVHRILFADYYPWAGQDRAVTMPNGAVSKGPVLFSHPQSARLAVEHGLTQGQDQEMMANKPGEVMGLLAYGHPFLEGNGRTMLLVHIEMCHRAGFSIAWHKTDKAAYLDALSREIDAPGSGALDCYLFPFKGPCVPRQSWGADILAMRGLNGLDDGNEVDSEPSSAILAAASAHIANKIASATPEKKSSEIGPEAIALGEVARLKGVREDQIPNFVKTAQAFIDQAKRGRIDLPALKRFDPKTPSAPAVVPTSDKTRGPRGPQSIGNPHLDKAPKR